MASIVAEGDIEKNAGSAPNPWKLCSVTRVEEVKMMIRLLPINMGCRILDFIRTDDHLFS